MKDLLTKHAKLYMIASIMILLGAVGITYAYYSAIVSNNTSLVGEAGGGTAPTLSVDLVSEDATGNLIPIDMDKDTLTKAASANPKCIDKNGYSACQIYSVTVTNNSDIDQSYNITLSSLSGTNTPNVDAVSMGTSNSVVTDASSIKETGNICTTNSVGKGETTDTCYFMVVIKNINSAQTDNGTFNGTVTATSTTGSEVKADFGEKEEYTPYTDFDYYIGKVCEMDDCMTVPEGQVLLWTYTGTNPNVIVLSSYNINGTEYATVIGSDEVRHSAFSHNGTIESVTFEDGVSFAYVDENFTTMNPTNSFLVMFEGCTSLKSVVGIPDTIIDLTYAFWGCTSLVNAPEIPNTVTNMQGTFQGCTSLVNAPVIPNTVSNMYDTFKGCTSLVNAPVIPRSVTYMYDTFANCTNLTGTVRIESSTILYSGTFGGTEKAIRVEVPAGSTTYTSFSNANLPSNVTLATFAAN